MLHRNTPVSARALAVLSALTCVACSQHPRLVSDVPTPAAAAFAQDQHDGRDIGEVRDARFGEPTTPFPEPLIGLWAVSPDVCESPEGEGWIRISADSLTAYEAAFRPLTIRPVSPGTWAIEYEESYLGTQFAKVIQTISVDGRALTVQPEDGQLERYFRCGE